MNTASARSAVPGLIVALLLATILAAAGSAGQQPTFRTSTRLIVQTVSVKGKDGRPIEGLAAKDFVVTEDGDPQTISFVEFQRLQETPDPLPAATSPVTGAASNTNNVNPGSNANSGSASGASAGNAARNGAPTTQAQIATPSPGDVRGAEYRDRRLLILYFDLTAMPPPDQSRGRTGRSAAGPSARRAAPAR